MGSLLAQQGRQGVWNSTRRRTLALGLLVFAFAVFAFSLYGLYGNLGRDDAFYLYIGQQIARGVPPYVRCYDAKTPLASYVIGAAVTLAQLLRLDDVLTVRAAFLIIASLAAAALYFAAQSLFGSRRIGLLASLTLVAFPGFAKHAASGPRPKTLGVLWEILALWCTAERRWLAAGVWGGLAVWTWQPLAIVPLTTVVMALLQTSGMGARLCAAARVVVGFLIPSALLSALLIWQGAWPDFFHQTILINLPQSGFGGSGGTSPPQQVLRLFQVLWQGYGRMAVAAVLGACAGVCLVLRGMRKAGGPRAFLAGDRLAGWAISWVGLLMFALWDFQWYVDLYVLLPFVALSLAWLLARGGAAAARRLARGSVTARGAAVFSCLLLAGLSIVQYAPGSHETLNNQRQWAREIAAAGNNGEPGWLLALGRPEILALLHESSDHPYVYPDPGIYEHLERNYAGGFSGWLEQQLLAQPTTVVLGDIRPARAAAATEEVLGRRRYAHRDVGNWTVFRWEPDMLVAPVGLQASDGVYGDRVRLTWRPVQGAVRYEIYRSRKLAWTGDWLGETSATRYDDPTAETCRTTYYWVEACDALGCSQHSVPDSGFVAGPAPRAPASCYLVGGARANRLELGWEWPPGAERFVLYRAAAGEAGEPFAEASRARYLGDAAVGRQAYEYWVEACNVCGCSPPSRRTKALASGP